MYSISGGHEDGFIYAHENMMFNDSRISAYHQILENNIFCNDSTYGITLFYYFPRSIGGIVESRGNIYRNKGGAIFVSEGGSFISQNDIYLECNKGVYFDGESAVFDHCFFSSPSNHEYPSLFIQSGQMEITNCIFINDATPLINEQNDNANIVFRNNAFRRNDELAQEAVDGFGILDHVNVNGDSVDTYGNLFGDPDLLDFYPYEYRLRMESVCIDAALRINGEADPDGTLPDIGPVPFNHDNQLFDITGSYAHPGLKIELGTELQCGVEVVDADEDSLIYEWELFRGDPGHNDTLYFSVNGLISRSDNVTVNIERAGFYQLRCRISDGYEINTFIFDIEVNPVGVQSEERSNPLTFKVFQNYPNPFNSSTIITFTVPERSMVKVSVFDIRGRLVRVLSEREYNAGFQSICWQAENLPAGSYIANISMMDSNESILLNYIK